MKLRLLLALAARHRASLAAGAVLLLLESTATLALPWLAGQAASRLIEGSGIAALLTALLGVAALQAVLRWMTALRLGRTAADVLADLRLRVHEHLQALPLAFHQSRPRGELTALMTHELSQLAAFLAGTLLAAVPALITALGAILLMARIDLRLGLLVGALIPLFFLLTKFVSRRLRSLAVELQQADASVTATAEESLRLLPATKAFTREPERQAAYAARVESVRRLGREGVATQAALEPLLQFIGTAAAIVLLWQLGSQIARQQMPPGEWVAFVFYAALLTRPISRLAALYGQAAMAQGTLEHLANVLAESTERDAEGAVELAGAQGEIRVEGVHFAYPGRSPVLSSLNLRVAAGETIALTGANGAGKTTLVHVLMRLHEPQGGRILLDGTDITRIRLRSLRQQVALVPQHVLLLHGSVRENIVFGEPGATEAQVAVALRLAQADAFVRALPQGLDTVVGDDGVRLSGGQRQRIALARALLKQAPVLVLDEPTAMFDPQAEQDFVAAMREARPRRTIILITHRPASLQLADRIVELTPPTA